MEGKKFSSSKRVVIYVRDLLSRYQADAFRYFVAAAGPENQDSDFTWSEFVRRTNDELVAGWGNLVNRTANMIAKNFGEIPAAGELTDEDQALLDHVEAAFGVVGDLIGRHRQKAGDRRGDARGRRGEQVRLRLRAVEAQGRRRSASGSARSCTWWRSASPTCNTILSPFLPFSANAVDAVLGGSGEVQPMPRLDEVDDLDGGSRATRSSPATTPARPGWERTPDRGRDADRQADAGLHQARPGRGRRGARPARGVLTARGGDALPPGPSGP